MYAAITIPRPTQDAVEQMYLPGTVPSPVQLRKIPHAKPFRLHDHRATLEATERATKAHQSAVAAFEGVNHE